MRNVSTAAAAFIAEVNVVMREHPKVSVCLEPKGESRARLESFWSNEQRRAGYGGRALRSILALADRHGVAIDLVPHWLTYDTRDDPVDEADRLEALNELKLSNEELKAWYERHGFTATGRIEFDDPVLERAPT